MHSHFSCNSVLNVSEIAAQSGGLLMTASYKVLPTMDVGGKPVLRMRVTVDYEIALDIQQITLLKHMLSPFRDGPDMLTQNEYFRWIVVINELSILMEKISTTDESLWIGLEAPERPLPNTQAASIIQKFGSLNAGGLRFTPQANGVLTIYLGSSFADFPTNKEIRKLAINDLERIHSIAKDGEANGTPPRDVAGAIRAVADVAGATASVVGCAGRIAAIVATGGAGGLLLAGQTALACGAAIRSIDAMMEAAKEADKARRDKAERELRTRECEIPAGRGRQTAGEPIRDPERMQA